MAPRPPPLTRPALSPPGPASGDGREARTSRTRTERTPVSEQQRDTKPANTTDRQTQKPTTDPRLAPCYRPPTGTA